MPSQAAVSKAITNAEMAWNCRRKTRGISVTTSKVEALVDSSAPRGMSLKFSSRKRKSLRSYKSKRGKYYEKGGSPTLEQEGLKAGQQQSLCYDGREADSNKPLADDDDDDDDEVMFMSSCIFEWDSGDLELLRQTKNIELRQKTRVRMPSQAAVSKAITKAEMAWNCRRKTRGICVRTSKDWSWSILQLRDGCLWSCHLERGTF
ncbi:unnamed protein product [Clavelina lepadiformis]|uniref:Uncharacterized protein n=1 Tax=Clavelina lepadiformis TaxID=159417 RepID=A0ABP0GLW8_CLALP